VDLPDTSRGGAPKEGNAMAHITRLAIVENESLLRDLLATGLAAQPTIEVVGTFGNAAEAIAGIPLVDADVVTLDVDLGCGLSGIDVGVALRRALPHLAIVLLSGQRRAGLLDAIPNNDLASWSCLLKDSLHDIKTLVEKIDNARQGIAFRDPSLTTSIRRAPGELSILTGRQSEVLTLIAEGHSNAGIARKLNLTGKSVQNYVTRLYERLGINAGNPDEHPRILALRHFLGGALREPSRT
jgi:DNA-binding NarL/FixJ family response regulator